MTPRHVTLETTKATNTANIIVSFNIYKTIFLSLKRKHEI